MKNLYLLLLFAAVSVAGQRYKVLSGDLDALKGISEYSAEFDYEKQTIHGFDSEEAFLQDKERKRSEEKAETFRENWFADRKNVYEPAFIDHFNERFPDGSVKITQNPESKYRIKVKTTWLYPGYGIGIGGEPAKVTVVITVFEQANPSNVLLKIEFDKSIGLESKGWRTTGDRIGGAYAKVGRMFAMQVKRVQ